MTGWQVEDSCTCPDDGHYGIDCSAHGGAVRDIATAFARWGQEVNRIHTDDLTKLDLRLYDTMSALEQLLGEHWRHDPPGPAPSPIAGVCGVCGNTGLIHGPSGNGNWTDDPCGCMTAFCGGCGGVWPCQTVRIIGNAAGVLVGDDQIEEEAAP